MAIDFLILTLLIISFIINLLALCAFWVTPGLRTTANRFTINLLIINLIGCCILGPTLFLSGTELQQQQQQHQPQQLNQLSSYNGLQSAAASADSIEIYSKPGNHQVTIRHNGKLVEQDGIIVERSQNKSGDQTFKTFKCKSRSCHELTIGKGKDGFYFSETEIEEDNFSFVPDNSGVEEQLLMQPLHSLELRCWSIDMTAALGALAVLLVVGDTWCAVTDPLRYHSRISGVKTWIFIALTWAIGILFGALSAFRVLDFEADTLLSKHRRFAATYFNISSTNSIFGIVYACVYFIVIILLPFGFVCGMYWRIFSEARGNGLRMRQNGSSPLLQSALNLTHPPHAGSLQYSNSLCVHRHSISSASSHGGCSSNGNSSSLPASTAVSGGLQMQIDTRRSSPNCLRRDSAAKVLLPTISDDGGSDDADAESTTGQLVTVPEHTLADRNQNILLTLQTASGEIKRNYSARQLPLLGTSSQDLRETQRMLGIRQVHSSPNLQKYTELRQDSLSEDCVGTVSGGSPHLLGHQQHQQQRTPRSQQQQQAHFCSPRHQQLQHQQSTQSQALQIPAIHASPKALSYMSSLRHRLSNASSLFKYREESRAARISILVVIMFLVSYLPFGFLVLLQARLSAANFGGSTQLAIFMLLLGNLSSPFIFAYRNKRVRRGVKRLFGLEARGVLQRHCSSSVKTNGTSAGGAAGNGATVAAQLQRNSSKLSQYSSNSCKYLTPQSSLGATSTPLHTALTLRPNSSCSTIINFGASREHKSSAESDELPVEETVNMAASMAAVPVRPPRPKLQRGITIVEHITVAPPKFHARRGLFDMFFRGSKKLQSCAHGEPTEV